MAVVLQGFLGPFTGKVGGAVGGIWKGINYIKGYVIPANPNTAGQQAQRTKFKNVQQLAQTLLGTVVSTFWNPIAVKMSGYNYFIQQFINSASSTGLALASSVVARGNLYEVPFLAAPTYNSGTGALVVTYDGTLVGNAEATDDVHLLVIDSSDNTVVNVTLNAETRTTEEITTSIGAGLTVANLLVYLWASRGTGSTFIASNSTGYQAVTS